MQLSCGTSHIVRGRVFYNGLGAMNGVTVALVVNQTVIESTQTDDSGFFSFNVYGNQLFAFTEIFDGLIRLFPNMADESYIELSKIGLNPSC